jgi:aromatic ring-opening dioxygenase LigB subunit
MSIEKVVIMPHPPIALPEVAGPRFNEVNKTAGGMKQLAKDIMQLQPETVIVITPHSNMHRSAFAVFVEPKITSSFVMFGAPQVQLSYKNDLDFIQILNEVRHEKGKTDLVQIKPGTLLDHGCGVPLYYLSNAGYKGNVVAINYSMADIACHKDFGQSLLKASNRADQKIILVASGDLSHRITPFAPAGFHPDGEKFDQIIVKAVETGNYEEIININPSLRQNAGECAYNSLMVALGALSDRPESNKVYSYEAPFGVGYLVASL